MTTEKKRILIVDDEENLTWSIANNLKKEFKQHEIFSVNSGDQALEILQKMPFDLVISDIQMPGTDGLTLLDYITENMPQAKVILMTSLDKLELRMMAEKFGIYFFEKPFDMPELKKAIRQVIEKNPQPENNYEINESLQDLILLQNETRFTGYLTIKTDSDSGIIFFQHGEIIHARTDNFEGEMALINILNWNHFSCEAVVDKKKPGRKTIYYGWTLLKKDLSNNISLPANEETILTKQVP